MKPRCLIVLGCALLVWLPVAGVAPTASAQGYLTSVAPMLERVTPSVVNIATSTTVQVNNPLLNDPFFRRFYNIPHSVPRYRKVASAGSGVMLDAAQGIVITNFHVVGFADEIVVGLTDGTNLKAEYIGGDAPSDIAVLRVNPDDLPPLPKLSLQRPKRLRVGDFVVAIGNPFGIGQTVTGGMVSAVGRSGLGLASHEDLIQTDASINPGNSGGALVDVEGVLVGINTAILRTAGGGNVGIGFAIPVDLMLVVSEQLQAYAEVRRGHFGAEVGPLDADVRLAQNLSETEQGVVVTVVDPGSPADLAGIEAGMVLLSLNDRKLISTADYYGQASTIMVGDRVRVRAVSHEERRLFTVDIPHDAYAKVSGSKLSPALTGAIYQNNRAGVASEIPAGVMVIDVIANSNLARRGLRAGDLLTAAGKTPVRHLSDLAAFANQPGSLTLDVHRNGRYVGRLKIK